MESRRQCQHDARGKPNDTTVSVSIIADATHLCWSKLKRTSFHSLGPAREVTAGRANDGAGKIRSALIVSRRAHGPNGMDEDSGAAMASVLIVLSDNTNNAMSSEVSAIRRDAISRLDDASLSRVFLEVVDASKTYTTDEEFTAMIDAPMVWWDDGLPRAPFHLAAVCRHWRRVALDTKELWTHLVTHSDTAPVEAVIQCWSELLVRCARPLPGARALPLFMDISGPRMGELLRLATVAISQACRIEHLELRLMPVDDGESVPDQMCIFGLLQMLRSPFPTLTSLEVSFNRNMMVTLDALDQECALGDMPNVVSIVLKDVYGPKFLPDLAYPALTYLSVHAFEVAISSVWSMVHAAPNLKHISLGVALADSEPLGEADRAVSLRFLHTLGLAWQELIQIFELSIAHISFPKMNNLIIDAAATEDRGSTLMSTFGAALTRLELKLTNFPFSLQNLNNLQSLLMNKCAQDCAFLAALAEDTTACPLLSGLFIFQTKSAQELGVAIVRLLTIRNARSVSHIGAGDAAPPCRAITSMVFPDTVDPAHIE